MKKSNPEDLKNLDSLLEYLEEQETQQQTKNKKQQKQQNQNQQQVQQQQQQKDQEEDPQQAAAKEDVGKFTQTLSKVPGLEQVFDAINSSAELEGVLNVLIGAAAEKLEDNEVKKALRGLIQKMT